MAHELKLIYSFRARLLLVLAALLVVTLGVQYYLNLRDERRSAHLRAEQEQAIIAGVALGMSSISSGEYIVDLRKRANLPPLDESAGRITNVLVVDNNGRITDSLRDYNPVPNDDGTLKYFYLRDIPLPPLVNAIQLTDDNTPLLQAPNAERRARAGGPRAIPIPVETDNGRWYVVVVLGPANASSSIWNRQAARSVLYTLIVLLAATLLVAVLVWRFTRPIRDLSDAARRVAAGDFGFRVPASDRRDEMGALAARFNEMIARLGRTRELEAQLHQAEQSAVVGRLASAIAHEIRNPLNYINLTLDHLRTAFAPQEQGKRETFERLAVQLKAEVARINTRVSEFLNYSRPAKLELQPLDLRAAAEDALRLVEAQAAESSIETRIEQRSDLPPVMADAESLRSVFINLYINALQAIDGDGGKLTVTLSTEEPGHRARVDVTDTGRGIAPENIARVFEPYYSTKETGTGLGLAIVKKTIDDHGGTISVTSKQGGGTTFTITLPIAINAEC